MASSTARGTVDPTKPAKYPVILSDELLGKGATRELYTAIKYNHKPTLSSDAAPARASLKPSAAHPGTFNLAFNDNGGKYFYNGVRETSTNDFVLIFDPARKAFVLHRVDSAFCMNLVRTPDGSDADALRAQYPHIETKARTESKPGGEESARSAPAGKSSKSAPARKPGPAKDKTSAPAPLTLPTVVESPKQEQKLPTSSSSRQKRRKATPSDSEESSDDGDDGGLLIEYPDEGRPSSARHRQADFSPAFPPQNTRRFSEFVRTNLGEDEHGEDADVEFEDVQGREEQAGEEEEEEEGEEYKQLAAFKLPSPVNHPSSSTYGRQTVPATAATLPPLVEEEGDAEADDIEADLEAELENALQEANRDMDSESSVSEED